MESDGKELASAASKGQNPEVALLSRKDAGKQNSGGKKKKESKEMQPSDREMMGIRAGERHGNDGK